MLNLGSAFTTGVCVLGLVAGLAACQRTDDLPGRQPVESPEKTRESKVGDPNTETKKLIRGMNEAHQIFEEVFKEIWNDKSFQTQSVFSEVARLISLHHNEATGEAKVQTNQCSGIVYQLVTLNQMKVLRQTDCRTQPSIKRDLMTIQFLGSQKYIWNFETAHLQKGAGLALSIRAEDIRCEVELENDVGLLKRLRCKGLGQNYNRDEYVVFTEYQYVRGDQNLMFVRGDKYSEFGKIRSQFEMPIPMTGVITYSEKVLPTETGAEVISPAETPPPAPEAPAAKAAQSTDANYGLDVQQVSPTQLADHKVASDFFPQCENDEDKQVFLRLNFQAADIDEDCQIVAPDKERQANELIEKLKAGG
jgi:hypothetical protein